jgi:hypothetical protein
MQKKTLFISSSGLSRGVRWLDTDVSGLPIGPIFKRQASSSTARPFKMEPIRSPETSVSNHLKLPTNPENGTIRFNRGRSLR